MSKKNERNTKGKIINAAWDLFYEQGYEDTTVEDIIAESGTSKGSFYHYFEGKDALLGSLSYIFDEEYEKLKQYMADQIKEIEIHKWLESEKANRDLGEEAVKDWIEKHAAEFRERWEKEHKSYK